MIVVLQYLNANVLFSKSDSLHTQYMHYRYVSLGRIGFETTKPSSLESNYQSKCYI